MPGPHSPTSVLTARGPSAPAVAPLLAGLFAPLLAGGVLLASPGAAEACGGLFCSNAPTPVQLQPVEQNAERVLFEVNADGTVTATVEILYTGEPDAFSWIVPVPGTPELDVAPSQALLLLDDASAPTLWNQPTVCRGNRSYGCNVGGAIGRAAPQVLGQLVRDAAVVPLSLQGCPASGDDDDSSDYWDEGVDVYEYPQVGPFDAEVVSSDDPDAVIAWLNSNDYLVTPEMEPFIAAYVQEGMNFLAMKLATGKDVSSIAPIRITYEAEQPTLPIRLTAVSAEPDMGILVFVAGDERWQAANYGNLTVDPYDVRSDPNTAQTNYYALISWVADLHGGQAMFTEYSGSTRALWDTLDQRYPGEQFDAESDFVFDLSVRAPVVTRLYTRLSAWEMTIDPLFEPSEGGGVDNRLDLGDNPPLDLCSNEPGIAACGDQYCGDGASCALTELGQGCVCPEGSVARRVLAPEVAGTLSASVVCQDLGFDLMASLPDMLGGEIDACGLQSCGEFGECVTINGFAACSCDDGYAAVATFGNGDLAVCTPVISEWGPEQIVGASPASVPSLADAAGATGQGGGPLGAALGFGLLAIPVLVARRKTRRAR